MVKFGFCENEEILNLALSKSSHVGWPNVPWLSLGSCAPETEPQPRARARNKLLIHYPLTSKYWLQDFGAEKATYISEDNFSKCLSVEETIDMFDCTTNMWCVVHLEAVNTI